MTNKFAIFDAPEHKGKKWISPSMASRVLNCPWSYWAHYEADIWAPKSLAMIRGSYFDWLCGGGHTYRSETRLDGIKTIEQRYREYADSIPPATFQHPVMIDLSHRNWWARGFVDVLPDDPALPFIEVKLATRPWKRRKIAYNRPQVLTYSKGLDGRPGRLDVSNMAEPGLQQFVEKDYLPRGKTLDDAWSELRKKFFLKAIKRIEKADWEPEPNILCKGENADGDTWECDYLTVCPLTREEKRIKEIMNGYF